MSAPATSCNSGMVAMTGSSPPPPWPMPTIPIRRGPLLLPEDSSAMLSSSLGSAPRRRPHEHRQRVAELQICLRNALNVGGSDRLHPLHELLRRDVAEDLPRRQLRRDGGVRLVGEDLLAR